MPAAAAEGPEPDMAEDQGVDGGPAFDFSLCRRAQTDDDSALRGRQETTLSEHFAGYGESSASMRLAQWQATSSAPVQLSQLPVADGDGAEPPIVSSPNSSEARTASSPMKRRALACQQSAGSQSPQSPGSPRANTQVSNVSNLAMGPVDVLLTRRLSRISNSVRCATSTDSGLSRETSTVAIGAESSRGLLSAGLGLSSNMDLDVLDDDDATLHRSKTSGHAERLRIADQELALVRLELGRRRAQDQSDPEVRRIVRDLENTEQQLDSELARLRLRAPGGPRRRSKCTEESASRRTSGATEISVRLLDVDFAQVPHTVSMRVDPCATSLREPTLPGPAAAQAAAPPSGVPAQEDVASPRHYQDLPQCNTEPMMGPPVSGLGEPPSMLTNFATAGTLLPHAHSADVYPLHTPLGDKGEVYGRGEVLSPRAAGARRHSTDRSALQTAAGVAAQRAGGSDDPVSCVVVVKNMRWTLTRGKFRDDIEQAISKATCCRKEVVEVVDILLDWDHGMAFAQCSRPVSFPGQVTFDEHTDRDRATDKSAPKLEVSKRMNCCTHPDPTDTLRVRFIALSVRHDALDELPLDPPYHPGRRSPGPQSGYGDWNIPRSSVPRLTAQGAAHMARHLATQQGFPEVVGIYVPPVSCTRTQQGHPQLRRRYAQFFVRFRSISAAEQAIELSHAELRPLVLPFQERERDMPRNVVFIPRVERARGHVDGTGGLSLPWADIVHLPPVGCGVPFVTIQAGGTPSPPGTPPPSPTPRFTR
eukprot:TRINITY_DN70479_c0_g1_i1.p1 TRINITY_DN70479_c0_g1~~TRINITY_DN70479_c0_g1_i1.p1  ORF type:complete len:797 (+),score=128.08 TRINITY_DN70479_c0_g1_i1:108-2393(+)